MSSWHSLRLVAIMICGTTVCATVAADDFFDTFAPAATPTETKPAETKPEEPAAEPAKTEPAPEAAPATEPVTTEPAATEAAPAESATKEPVAETPATEDSTTPKAEEPVAATADSATEAAPETPAAPVEAKSEETSKSADANWGSSAPESATSTAPAAEKPADGEGFPPDPELKAPTTDQPAPAPIGQRPGDEEARKKAEALAKAVLQEPVPVPPAADGIISVEEELQRSVAVPAKLSPERRAQLREYMAKNDGKSITAAAQEYALELRHPMFGDAARARDALILLGKAGADAAAGEMKTQDRLTRALAISVLREVGSDAQIAALLPLLDDGDPVVRYHAVLALRERFRTSFDYSYLDVRQDRLAAMARWKQFLDNQTARRKLAEEEAARAAAAAAAATKGAPAGEAGKTDADDTVAEPGAKDSSATTGDTATTASAPAATEIVLDVAADGKVSLNGTAVPEGDLEKTLAAERARVGELPVTVRASRSATYERVAVLMGLCRRLGLKDVNVKTVD